jgi:AraC-like DNA-binding protein
MMFQGDSIQYHFPVVDRQRGRGYLVGFNRQSKQVYVLSVDYTENPAPLTLYYTDPLPNMGLCWPVLDDDGNLILAGGLDNSNYYPLKSVVVLRVNPEVPMIVAHASFSWLWLGVGLALLAAFIVYLIIIHARKASQCMDNLEEKTDEANETEDSTDSTRPTSSITEEELLQRICQLMEEERLYLNSGLKMSDVATMVGCNRNTLSACINNLHHCSFSQFVNTYRVEHAKQLLRKPDTRATEVWMETGFANETTFFRTFKAIVGMTPSEWKSHNQQ